MNIYNSVHSLRFVFFSEIIEVPISECVHYCGFRYNTQDYNPYETYIKELHHDIPKKKRQNKFVDFLQYYRPKDLGEALGIQLSKYYQIWQHPWIGKILPYDPSNMDIDKIPDIITHFSESGIKMERINEEFSWLENAYYSILKAGFHPEKYGFIKVLCLERTQNIKRYLVLDGNHRISALSALEHAKVKVKILRNDSILYSKLEKWKNVMNNIFTKEDAVKVFEAYFNGNQNYRTTSTPARLI